MFLCFFIAGASLCHAKVPQAEMLLNGSLFARGNYFSATFHLESSITQPFTVYTVVIMPDGSMLDTLTLGPKLNPAASNMPRLDPPLLYPLISLNLPSGAPLGNYEVVAAFFDPSKPITGRQAAFLDVSGKFEIVGNSPGPDLWYAKYGPSGTGDVVIIGSVYVASKKDGPGCMTDQTQTWNDAANWVNDLSWLDKDDWRMPTKNELSAICTVKDTVGGFSYSPWYYWSSTGELYISAWCVNFGDCTAAFSSTTGIYGYVRAVRDVE